MSKLCQQKLQCQYCDFQWSWPGIPDEFKCPGCGIDLKDHDVHYVGLDIDCRGGMFERTSDSMNNRVHQQAIRERSFYREWSNEHSSSDLLANVMKGCIPGNITDRERFMANTLIQWLGTNVGFSFVVNALERAGYEIKKNKKMSDLFMKKGATFSDCGLYRYRLWRVWDPEKPLVLFVMLNPSTADENYDDPTVSRCITYAGDWGYGGLYVGNLFAYRATDPSEMKSAVDPIGPRNDWHLAEMANEASKTIFAWGAHGSYMDRANEVRDLVDDPYFLDLTKDGEPRHPLYLPKDLEPKPFKTTPDFCDPPGYIESLRQLPADVYKAYLMGDPDAFRLDPEDELFDEDQIIYRKKISVNGALARMMQDESHREAIENLLEVFEKSFTDPGLQVYDRNNEVIASLSPEDEVRVKQVLLQLMNTDLTPLQKNNLEDVAKYQELISAVKSKFPEESRHETALRYIKEAEDEN